MIGNCELCNRELHITKHHLIPKSKSRTKRGRKRYTKNRCSETIDICRPCHDNIHNNFKESTLEIYINTLELLKQQPEISSFTEWIKKRPEKFIPNFKGNKNKR